MGSRRCKTCDHLFFAHGPNGCRECGCTAVKGGLVRGDSPSAVDDLLHTLGLSGDPEDEVAEDVPRRSGPPA